MNTTNPPCRRAPLKKGASFNRLLWFLAGVPLTIFILSSTGSAQQAFDFKNHPFFKYFAGDWTAEGQGGSTGAKLEKYKVAWKANASDANTFVIEGSIEEAGKTTHYKKTITRSASGSFDAVVQPDTSKPDTQRYTVQFAPDGSRMEMTLLLAKKAKETIVDSFKGGLHDEVEFKLKITDPTGAVTFSSASVSKRAKR